MTAKGRIHAIRLAEKTSKNPVYSDKIGVKAEIKTKNVKNQQQIEE